MDAGQLPKTGDRSSSYEDHMSGAAGLQFVTDVSSIAHFVATVGWHVSELSDGAKQLLQPGKIDAILDRKAALYQERRPHIQGLFNGAPEAIGNSMFWNTLYVPALGLEFPTLAAIGLNSLAAGLWGNGTASSVHS